jgi:hypothetical protein
LESAILLAHFTSVWTLVFPLLYDLLAVIVYLLLGFWLARLLGYGITSFLKIIQFDWGLKQLGFSTLLEKGEIRKTPSQLAGDLFYWLVLFVAVIGLAKFFSLPVEPALLKVFSYLGLIFLATVILGTGLFFASLFSGMVRLAAVNFGLEGAKSFSRVIYYLVISFSFLIALAQLGISSAVFVSQVGVIIGAVGLAAAIAFGLGCKDLAADFLHNLFKGK